MQRQSQKEDTTIKNKPVYLYLFPLFLLVLLLVATGEFLKAVVVLALSMLFRYLKTACKQQEGAKPYFSVPAEKAGQLTLMRKPTALFRGLLLTPIPSSICVSIPVFLDRVCSGAACCAWSR